MGEWLGEWFHHVCMSGESRVWKTGCYGTIGVHELMGRVFGLVLSKDGVESCHLWDGP